MTMELGTSHHSHTPSTYKKGDAITIAQLGEEKIECKVESRLGEGATASVFQVVTSNGKSCALKVFKSTNSAV